MTQLSTSQKRIILFIFCIGAIIAVLLSINTYTLLTADSSLPTLVVFPSDTITPSPTMTFTPPATYTSTGTPSPTLTHTATHTSTATATNTSSPTATHTNTVTPSQTPTLTQTATASPIPVVANTAIPTRLPVVQNTAIPPQNVIVINTSVPIQIPSSPNTSIPPQIPTATYTPIPSPTNVPPIPIDCIQYAYWNNNPRYVNFNSGNFLPSSAESFITPDCSGFGNPLDWDLAYAPGGLVDANTICISHGYLGAEHVPELLNNTYSCTP